MQQRTTSVELHAVITEQRAPQHLTVTLRLMWMYITLESVPSFAWELLNTIDVLTAQSVVVRMYFNWLAVFPAFHPCILCCKWLAQHVQKLWGPLGMFLIRNVHTVLTVGRIMYNTDSVLSRPSPKIAPKKTQWGKGICPDPRWALRQHQHFS